MSEYKREIGFAVGVSFILALLIGAVAIYSFPTPTSINHGTTTRLTSTIPGPPITYTGRAVSLDPRLEVNPINGLLGSNANASVIAGAFATEIGESPVSFVSKQFGCPVVPGCNQEIFLFKTSMGSNMTVKTTNGSFIELDYIVKNYDYLHNSYWNNHTGAVQNPSSSAASVSVGIIMSMAFGIDLSRLSLTGNISGGGWVQWSQLYQGIPIVNGAVVYFEFYPPNSEVIRLVIDKNVGWYGIPTNLPTTIAPSSALRIAKEFALNTIQTGVIGYANISFAILQDHLYYSATISNQTKTIVLFVNPIDGSVGLPTS